MDGKWNGSEFIGYVVCSWANTFFIRMQRSLYVVLATTGQQKRRML